MPKDLERDLGLYAVFTISIGAMIGSGIFVLPGLAATIGGPAAILAYLLAGIIVLPAALSKAEMATAMPEAGGTYLYIERALGPLMGTIAGVGTWFSLSFKSAFALVGLGAYILLFTAGISTKILALVLAVVIILVNILGVKQTGRFQAVLVTGVMVVLIFYILRGVVSVESANYAPFLPKGIDGLLAATGFVFVSYAGVTKIASIAEEVEDPDRNIPVGILASILLMMVVYALIVYVIVGVTEPGTLGKTLTPMADAAEAFLGPTGVIIVGITAVAALTGMANAGVLSASRYPFAMGRDNLAPPMLTRIHDRFRTPVTAVTLTGGLLIVLILVFPVVELAKLASAFKILVFSLVNLALIGFRESSTVEYDPSFISPGYPWVQLFGIIAGITLIFFMGTLPIVGALAIVAAGALFYRFYGGPRTEREGAAVGTLRRKAGERAVVETQAAMEDGRDYTVLLPVSEEITTGRERGLIRMAGYLLPRWGGHVEVVGFEEVPDQVGLQYAAEIRTPQDEAFEQRTGTLSRELDVNVQMSEIVSHDTPRALRNYVRHHDLDLIFTDIEESGRRNALVGRDLEAYLDDGSTNTVFVVDRPLGEVEEVVVVADRGPYDPLKVAVADALAQSTGARVRLVTTLPRDAAPTQVEAVETYQTHIAALFQEVHVERTTIPTDDPVGDVPQHLQGADIVVMSTGERGLFGERVLGSLHKAVVEALDVPVLLVHSQAGRQRKGLLGRLVERLMF